MSKITVNIKSKKSDILDKIRRIEDKDLSVFVGIQDYEQRDVDDENKSEYNNAQIAAVHEFGAKININGNEIVIPERSFIRASIKENEEKYLKMNERIAKNILSGKTKLNEYLSVLGQVARDDMSNYATKLKDPPNSPHTIAKKKSENPLVNTRQMINSINYKVAPRKDFDTDA